MDNSAMAGEGPEDSDSAESAGPSGDEGDDALSDGGDASSPESAGASGDEMPGGRASRRQSLAELPDEDDTAFSDGEEAPLMSEAAVAAAMAGMEEPSSEDDDDEPEEGGMLADVDDSGEDSDATPEGVCTAVSRQILRASLIPSAAKEDRKNLTGQMGPSLRT